MEGGTGRDTEERGGAVLTSFVASGVASEHVEGRVGSGDGGGEAFVVSSGGLRREGGREEGVAGEQGEGGIPPSRIPSSPSPSAVEKSNDPSSDLLLNRAQKRFGSQLKNTVANNATICEVTEELTRRKRTRAHHLCEPKGGGHDEESLN
jgi:hypothetical protein